MCRLGMHVSVRNTSNTTHCESRESINMRFCKRCSNEVCIKGASADVFERNAAKDMCMMHLKMCLYKMHVSMWL